MEGVAQGAVGSAAGGALQQAAFAAATARLQDVARGAPRLSVLSADELAAWYPVTAYPEP